MEKVGCVVAATVGQHRGTQPDIKSLSECLKCCEQALYGQSSPTLIAVSHDRASWPPPSYKVIDFICFKFLGIYLFSLSFLSFFFSLVFLPSELSGSKLCCAARVQVHVEGCFQDQQKVVLE